MSQRHSHHHHQLDPSVEKQALDMLRNTSIDSEDYAYERRSPVAHGQQRVYYDTEFQDPYPDSAERPLTNRRTHGADPVLDRRPSRDKVHVQYKLPQPPIEAVKSHSPPQDEFEKFKAMSHFEIPMPAPVALTEESEIMDSNGLSGERQETHHRTASKKLSNASIESDNRQKIRRGSSGRKSSAKDFERPHDLGILPPDVVPMTHAMDIYLDNKAEQEERQPSPATLASPPDEVEERFLEMPESKNYDKVHTFNVDKDGDLVTTEKGYVYRRKSEASPNDPMSFTVDGAEIPPDLSRSRYAILLIGAPEVGKSSLIKQLRYCDSLDPGRLDSSIIDETDLSLPVLISGREIDLIFTDCDVLQDEKWELNMNFAAMLVVYSVTDEKSYSTASDILCQLRDVYSDDVPIILVANKIDLERHRVVETKEFNAFIFCTDGNKLAKNYNCKFIEVSVQLGCETNELLRDLLLDLKKYENE